MPHKPGVGAILGIVSEDGVPKESATVNLYDRTTGTLVLRQATNENGEFRFVGLDTETDDYQVSTQDDSGPPYKNALVRDRIQPVGIANIDSIRNWPALSAQYRVLAQFIPRVGIRSDTQPCIIPSIGSQSYLACFNSSNNPVAPPFASNVPQPGNLIDLPVVDISGCKVIIPGIPFDGARPFGASEMPAVMSLEAAFEPASVVGDVCFAAGELYADSSIFSGNPLTGAVAYIAIKYAASTQTLTVFACRNPADGATNFTSATAIISDYDMSSYQNGLHHIVATVKMGTSLKLYINGDLKTTDPLTGGRMNLPISAYNYAKWGGMFIGSNMTPFMSTGVVTAGKVALATLYGKELSGAEVANLYNAIMIFGFAAVTVPARPRKVLMHYPIIYLPLTGAALPNNNVHILTACASCTFSGNVVFGENPSLIDGETVAQVNRSGSGLITIAAGGGPVGNAAGFAFSAICKPAATPPPAKAYLCRPPDDVGFGINISGYVFVEFFLQVGGAQTVTFNSHLVDDESLHDYLVSVSATEGKADLYVDGVSVQQVTFTASALRTTVMSTGTGANAVVGEFYDGLLGHVAYYNSPLNADQALVLYTSLSAM